MGSRSSGPNYAGGIGGCLASLDLFDVVHDRDEKTSVVAGFHSFSVDFRLAAVLHLLQLDE